MSSRINEETENMLRCKGDNMIDETKLSKSEAFSFTRCMEDELDRHKQAKRYARSVAWSTTNKVIRKFYEYGEIRHQEDIKMIQKTIDYIKEKFA